MWLGGKLLCKRFRWVFDLADNKLVTVATMHVLGWEDGESGWRWRCQLWVWDEDLLDHWQWRPVPSRGYSVRGMYRLLTTPDVHTTVVTTDL